MYSVLQKKSSPKKHPTSVRVNFDIWTFMQKTCQIQYVPLVIVDCLWDTMCILGDVNDYKSIVLSL